MTVVFGGIVPHPPIMVPEVGGKNVQTVQQTVNAMKQLTQDLAEVQPDALVMVSPHAPALREGLGVFTAPTLEGNLASFGVPEIDLHFDNDLRLTKDIIDAVHERGYMMVQLQGPWGPELDHGAIVPLYYLTQQIRVPMVLFSLGLLPREDLYAFGTILQRVFADTDKRVAFIASGDLSHRLTPDAPAGYDPDGKNFDAQVAEAIRHWKPKEIMHINHSLTQKAGECGLRPIIILLGVFDNMLVKPTVLSYEGPFGVGYMVAKVEVDRR